MSLRVRKLLSSDALAAANITSCFLEGWSYNSMQDSLKNESLKSFVLEYNSVVVGFCSFLVCEDAELSYIAIDTAFQGRGYGHILLKQAMDILDIKSIVLEVRASNISAIGLYEKLGYKNIGVRKGLYSSPMDDGIVMQWNS